MGKQILVSTNPPVYLWESDSSESSSDYDDEYSDDDDLNEMVIIYDDCLITTIAQIEKNIRNGIPVELIYIFISNNNPIKEDIYNLIRNIYQKINFLLDDTTF